MSRGLTQRNKSDKMAICQIVPYFPYKEHLNGQSIETGYNIGGVERHVYCISKELLKRGHDVQVISTKSPLHEELTEIDGINVLRVPISFRIYNSHIPLKLIKIFNPAEFDLIHAHTPVPAMADLAALRVANNNIPFILTYHNDIVKAGLIGGLVSLAYNTAGRFLLRRSDIIISTTKSYSINSALLRKYSERVRIIPNGVDARIFNPNINGDYIRKKHDIDENKKVILFVGRLDHYKGCDYLVRAFEKILKKIENAHLMLVGSGPLKENLTRLAKNANIIDKISFAGYVKDKDLPFYYASSNVFVLPSVSSYEGFGIVQLEAMACGIPIVTTLLPGVREIDYDGVSTLHVQPRDEQQLSNAITKLLNDDCLAVEMGMKGRDLVISKYSWTKVVDLLESTYGELLR